MSKTRQHILHQYKVNLFGLADKIKKFRKPYKRKATKANK